jgi:hypothetical protein
MRGCQNEFFRDKRDDITNEDSTLIPLALLKKVEIPYRKHTTQPFDSLHPTSHPPRIQ